MAQGTAIALFITFCPEVTLRILGISAFYHDSAAALVVDGGIVAAAQEGRFTRIKHDSSFSQNAVRACLDIGGITLDDVDYIAFYDKPFLKFERLLVTYLSFAPHGFGSFQKGAAGLVEGKAVPQGPVDQETEEGWRR
jgi:predicted NodU family carbamoyl transferase